MHRRGSWLVLAVALGAAVPAAGAVFNVGGAGTYPTIQSAVDAAVVQGGTNEIRVQQGTYIENLTVPSTFTAGSLLLTGGWNAAFTARSQNPALTVVDGGAAGSVLTVQAVGGRVEVRGLTLTNGSSTSGGGVRCDLGGPMTVVIAGCHIIDNLVTAYTAQGGGLYLLAPAGAVIDIIGNRIEGNTCHATDSNASGGGIQGSTSGDGGVRVLGNTIRANEAHTVLDQQSMGAGAYLSASDTGSVIFSDNLVNGNLSTGVGTAIQTGAYIGAWQTASSVEIRRNLIWDNPSTKTGAVGAAFGTGALGSSTVVLSDTVVAAAGGEGIEVQAYQDSHISLSNVTVTDVAGRGWYVSTSGTATIDLANSVTWSTGSADFIAGAITSYNNLSNVDPLFVAAAQGNFQPGPGSPVISYGSNSAPAIGTTDLAGGDRIIGSTVDAGAYEYGNIFATGFEYGVLTGWQTVVY
ncbi:MAG: right-handed parallel beta-helix repeat-containing protein [Candidatus Krumholzibacteriia bacterium]